MATTNVLSQTLSEITAIKLEEISNQRVSFGEGKRDLLKAVDHEQSQAQKVRILLEGVEKLASMGDFDNTFLTNARRFIEQARQDPSVPETLQKEWEDKLRKDIDVHSVRYEYASLYGQLVKEWLLKSSEDTAFEKVGRKEMHDQRELWEAYVFEAKETDTAAITEYLKKVFESSKEVKTHYQNLRDHTASFETLLAFKDQFDEDTVKWVIRGLLKSDLVTDSKRKVLKDFLNSSVVLAEIADVLNMRMSSLDKWSWDSRGTLVEQRRQINGRYRFYHDEDLLQTILLRYIGVKWSIHFKEHFATFLQTAAGWKQSSRPLPSHDVIRRDYFLGPTRVSSTVESVRDSHFQEIFLEQLQDEIDDVRGYNDDSDSKPSSSRLRQNHSVNAVKTPQQITQGLLHVLATEIILKTSLGEDISVVRSDFQWFGPSLPHSTMLTVLKYFGMSDHWTGFFKRALEAPMYFEDAPVRTRKRGTSISGPLSDMLGETTLFVLDIAINQLSNGTRLYRLHDDIWFWGDQGTCVKGWKVMKEFSKTFGLDINEKKTGSVLIAGKGAGKTTTTAQSGRVQGLPQGDVRWGFLKLDAASGRFLIDQENVDKHISELQRQLRACKSVFDWIQAWNVYGCRFFTNNFGRPANCYGVEHVDMLLDTFARIQNKLFVSTGGSVSSTLKHMISDRFGVENIPEGYLYWPLSKGGLDLKSPFIPLYLVRETICDKPQLRMTEFLEKEEIKYRLQKKKYDAGGKIGMPNSLHRSSHAELVLKDFMPFEEYTRNREQTSGELVVVYQSLTAEPRQIIVEGSEISTEASAYEQWILKLYGSEMRARFGGLDIVDKGLLPTGLIGMARESRFNWEG